MEKDELLMSIGFSKEYISYLHQVDYEGLQHADVTFEEPKCLSHDTTNIIMSEAQVNATCNLLINVK